MPDRCLAPLNIKGEGFICDQPLGHGLAHGNTEAGAIWADEPIPPEPVTVSRAAIDELANVLTHNIEEPQGDSSQPALLRKLIAAARALVDEVRGTDS